MRLRPFAFIPGSASRIPVERHREIDRQRLVPALRRDILRHAGMSYHRVVDQHIDRTECVYCCVYHRGDLLRMAKIGWVICGMHA